METLFTANRLLDHVKSMKDHRLKIHPIPLEDLVIVAWADAAAINRYDGGSTQGIVIGATSRSLLKGECTPVSIVAWNSSKIGRVCSSPGSSEAIAAANAEDLLYFCRFQISEMMGNEVNIRDPNTTVNKIDGCLVTDSRNVYDKLKNEVIVAKGAERRTDVTLMRIKEGQSLNKVKVRWVHSEAQLANGLTKAKELRQLLLFYQLGSAWKIVEDPTMSSAKKRRRAKGLWRINQESRQTHQNNQLSIPNLHNIHHMSTRTTKRFDLRFLVCRGRLLVFCCCLLKEGTFGKRVACKCSLGRSSHDS